MNYFDDILNVYAYLFQKSAELEETSRNLTQKAAVLDQSYEDLNEQADAMLSEVDAMLAQAYALAEEWGVDTTGISEAADAAELELPEPLSGKISPDIRIPIPVNYDYHSQFQRLVQEARDAGFTDAHPEELLTREEMARAEAYADQLDAEFCGATQLQPKDLTVLFIAVAARVLFYFLSQKIRAIHRQRQEPSQEQPLPTPQLVAPQNSALSKEKSRISAEGTPPVLPISAAQGVDISGMLGNLANHDNAVKTGHQIANKVAQSFGGAARILDHNTILEQNTPFDIEETDLFRRSDIVAYHKYLGWIVGTLNILTDTITTYSMKSYSITRPMPAMGKPCVNQEISTLFSVVSPVMQSAQNYRDSVAAAAVQEALTQGFGKASPQEVRTLFGRAMELENRTAAYAEETKGVLSNFKAEWAACIGGIASTALINTIVAAVHAMLYEESDGSLDHYSIRTNKIILYSGAMATAINSLPAIASENIAELDFAGILTTCMSLFQSTRFWIEAKTEFLTSAYRQTLEEELAKLDRFFQYQ